MAELASGAVSSLLGLLRNEALLLSRVGNHVEFIKEEMESMHSFLEHLARTAPPAGGHDEQVRTWMKQVRDLAHDCSNCIDLYLRRGDPEFYRVRGGRWRYLWWASWLVQKMVAQRNAAIRLGELKERARDVGKRRLRYGVEIPRKEAGGSVGVPSMPPLSQAAATEEDGEEEEEEDHQYQASVAADGSDPRRRVLEHPVLEEYCAEKLANWLQLQAQSKKDVSIASIAIVAPDDTEDASSIAHESLTLASANFTCKVWINLSALHLPWDLPLLGWEILAYILQECKPQQGTIQDEVRVVQDPRKQAYQAYHYKDKLEDKIMDMIGGNDDDDDDDDEKIEEIKRKIGEIDEGKIGLDRKKAEETKSLGILLRALRLAQKAPDMGVPLSFEEIMNEAASRLKAQIEAGKSKPKICLDVTQYMDILRKVFPANKPLQPQVHEVSPSATTLGEDHIKEIIRNHKITLDIIWELLHKQKLLEGNSTKKEQATGSNQLHGGHDQVTNGDAVAYVKEIKEKMKEISREVQASSGIAADAVGIKETKTKEIAGEVKMRSAIINETKEKMDAVSEEIEDNLFIKGIVDMIEPCLKNKKTLIILQDDKDYISTEDDEDDVSTWKQAINALNLLACAPGSAVIVSTTNSQKAKEFCYPQGEPITCSLVGLYHDLALQLTQQRMDNENAGYNPRILREVLDKCHPHEFCMKVFVCALYANPNRSYAELCKLHEDLVSHKTFDGKAKKMLKFSYKDLPIEHKTCLLYLSIFPQGHNIRRSTLIGRWVTEGLITKQDWLTAVHHAERCFDALIIRGLVLPGDIGAAGKVKSCMVGDPVHGFITKIAIKEHILDARLSDLWAHHFSIFSGLRVRTTDSIEKFVHKLPKYSPQLPLLKVLDLEGTNICFDKNRYLKDICNKILLLKYLSLRGTNVTHLPNEINNLHELEVLDIRQTMVPERATRDVLLLKLRRFLAGRVNLGSRTDRNLSCSAVQIPCNIEKMEKLEVLSNVKASGDGHELKEIRNLWQLRKLGVVIEDRDNHLTRLLRAISDLKECLQSLSITISSTTKTKRTPYGKERQPKDMTSWLTQTPKHLESLTINGVSQLESLIINGVSQRGQLLESLAKGSDELAKVTLSGTLLEQENLMVLAVLPKLLCLRLRSNAYNGSKITFMEGEFLQLKYFLVDGTNITETDIEFVDGSTIELEKIILSATNIRFLSGIGNLPKLKELELKGNQFLLSFSQDRAAEPSPQSRAPGQNSESRATEQNSETRAPDQNTEIDSNALEENTKIGAPVQNLESRVPEQNTESRAAKENIESRFTFEKGKFERLNYFHVEDSRMTEIIFDDGAAPELKKISLSLTNKFSQLTGVSGLPKLKEIELTGGNFLLHFFENAHQIAKVTLRDTQLKKGDLQILAKKPNLRYLELSDKSYDESQLIFNEDEFPKLNHLSVECPINSISFTNGSAPKLEKIVWTFTEMKSLNGIGNLPKLKEIECIGDLVPHKVRKDIAAHKEQPVLTHKKPQQQGQGKEISTAGDDDDTRFPQISSFMKIKSLCLQG